MQVPAEDNHMAVDVGTASEGNVAAENQNVAGHRPVEKNISGENAHAASGATLNVGGAQKASRVTELFVRREQNVPANVEQVG